MQCSWCFRALNSPLSRPSCQPLPRQTGQLLTDSCSARSALDKVKSYRDTFRRFRSFCLQVLSSQEGEQNHSIWEGLGFFTEPSRKVQGGVLGTNDLIALALGGTSRLILGERMQPACDACCCTLTMLLALGWTEIRGHCVLGKIWLRIYLRIYPGGTLGIVCAKTVCSVSLTACSYVGQLLCSESSPSRRTWN